MRNTSKWYGCIFVCTIQCYRYLFARYKFMYFYIPMMMMQTTLNLTLSKAAAHVNWTRTFGNTVQTAVQLNYSNTKSCSWVLCMQQPLFTYIERDNTRAVPAFRGHFWASWAPFFPFLGGVTPLTPTTHAVVPALDNTNNFLTHECYCMKMQF